MVQPHQLTVQKLSLAERLALLFDVLDALHSAASEGCLETAGALDYHQLVGLLGDIIYTAQQTLDELEREERAAASEPPLRIVKRPASLKKAE